MEDAIFRYSHRTRRAYYGLSQSLLEAGIAASEIDDRVNESAE
jgi:hypothetical protein